MKMIRNHATYSPNIPIMKKKFTPRMSPASMAPTTGITEVVKSCMVLLNTFPTDENFLMLLA